MIAFKKYMLVEISTKIYFLRPLTRNVNKHIIVYSSLCVFLHSTKQYFVYFLDNAGAYDKLNKSFAGNELLRNIQKTLFYRIFFCWNILYFYSVVCILRDKISITVAFILQYKSYEKVKIGFQI